MKKPIVFLDFDGLKFDTVRAHMLYINEKYAIESVESDYIDNPQFGKVIRKYKKNFNMNEDKIWEDVGKNFLASHKHHEAVIPIIGMCEIVPKLAEKYTLWTVTARSQNGSEVISRLINKYIPNCIAGIHYVWIHKGNATFDKHPKRDFIEKMKGEKIAFFDDSPSEIIHTQDIIPSYLFDPKRLHEKATHITNRVYSWEEIGNILL